VVHEVLGMKSRSKAANDSIQLYNEVMASYANKRRRPEEHQVGDLVMLSTKFFKLPSDSSRARKLSPKFARPYKVTKRLSPVTYRLELPQERMFAPSFTLPYSRRIMSTLLVKGRPKCLRLFPLMAKRSMWWMLFLTNGSAVERRNIWFTGPVITPMTPPGNQSSMS
jgi:hypothetical protein